MTSLGDKIIAEVEIPAEETIAINKEYTNLIRKRTKELILKHPEKEKLFLDYVKKQEEECEIINNEITGCVWCLQKN
jgi:hypothetical protein